MVVPLFSVVMPLYNKEKFIGQALSSVLHQDYSDFEILVVDDCSTDGSVNVLAGFSDPRIKVFRRESPGPGGYLARNYGVEMASGDWVVFLDADDFWDENHLSALVELIREYPHADLLSAGYRIVDRGAVEIVAHEMTVALRSCEALKVLLWRDLIHTNSVCIKRTLYESSGGFRGDKGWKRGGDSEFWLRLVGLCSTVILSGKVTSNWILDRSEITNKRIVSGEKHPALSYLAAPTVDGYAHCQRLVRLYVNRKQLTWELQGKLSWQKAARIARIVILFPDLFSQYVWRAIQSRIR
ncbi:glycosyltransferase [Pseudotabrizicola sp. 4114]|uniref:glycosyltransferase family 2 protein n=1 Tax=Pseudotabrizicola sp. 4114 TaxID=2817731 RepID=UPI002860137A|nr:glycosyltransferase involved in cell wall biosynthesis [Pseudorhodobacter sp. 4114]